MIKRGAVLITGAAKRLGRDMASALAHNGYDLVLHYHRSKADAMDLANALKTLDVNVHTLCADLKDMTQVRHLIEQAFSLAPNLCGLINNACHFDYDRATNVDDGALETHMRVNVYAPAVLIKDFARIVKGDVRPLVINMLDAKLDAPNPDYFSYTLSKGALQTLTQLCAQEYAGKMRVVGIAPSLTLHSEFLDDEKLKERQTLNLNKVALNGQMIAKTVVFCFENEGINGSVLRVDAGAALMPVLRDFPFLTKQDVETYAHILPPKQNSSE